MQVAAIEDWWLRVEDNSCNYDGENARLLDKVEVYK